MCGACHYQPTRLVLTLGGGCCEQVWQGGEDAGQRRQGCTRFLLRARRQAPVAPRRRYTDGTSMHIPTLNGARHDLARVCVQNHCSDYSSAQLWILSRSHLRKGLPRPSAAAATDAASAASHRSCHPCSSSNVLSRTRQRRWAVKSTHSSKGMDVAGSQTCSDRYN
jgi:hypothetical protein